MKTANTFGIQFVIRANKRDSSISLIYARITVNGMRIEMSLKRTIDSTSWNHAKECVKGTSAEVNQLNKSIEEARFKLRECYLQLQMLSKLLARRRSGIYFLVKQDHKTLYVL